MSGWAWSCYEKKKEQILRSQTLAYLIGNLRTKLHDNGLKQQSRCPQHLASLDFRNFLFDLILMFMCSRINSITRECDLHSKILILWHRSLCGEYIMRVSWFLISIWNCFCVFCTSKFCKKKTISCKFAAILFFILKEEVFSINVLKIYKRMSNLKILALREKFVMDRIQDDIFLR